MKIVSGGQTGVDIAALDAAIKLGIPHGGWCPKGRLAELGTVIPKKYQLKETASPDFDVRTRLNIRDSDGTLIVAPKDLSKITDGTILTINEVKKIQKPYLLLDISKEIDPMVIKKWIKSNDIEVLNIAGPRESQSKGIYKLSYSLFVQTFFPLFINPEKNEESENTYHYRARI